MKKFFRVLRANLFISVDLESIICSVRISALLITWDNGYFWRTIGFSWYGFNYWDVQEIDEF